MRFYDTSSLLNIFDKIFDEPFVISYISIAELEHIKISSNKDENLKCRARQITRLLTKNIGKYDVYMKGQDKCMELVWDGSNDSIILCGAIECSQRQDIVFVTDDLLLRLRAVHSGLKVTSSDEILESSGEYIGYKTVVMSTDDMSEFYTYPDRNPFGCLVNEYLLIKNTSDEIVDKQKWNGTSFKQIGYKTFNNDFLGRVKPLSIEQEMAFDMLQDTTSKVKILFGSAGSGKDYMMLSHALHFVKQNKYKKIIWVRNNVEVKNTRPLGALPGTKTEKLFEFSLPMADHLGGREGLERMIEDGVIEIEHLGFLRGRSLSDCIVICSEAENATTNIVQLLLSRICENSMLWLNGDYRQVDDRVFENDNGLKNAIEKLKGNPLFACVRLNNVERSNVSQLAELLY